MMKTAGPASGEAIDLTFDADEAFTLGYIPLDKLQAQLKWVTDAKGGIQIRSINFKENGYCTDAVLRCIAISLKNAQGLTDSLQEINLLGCGLITDTGLHWLASLLHQKFSNSFLSIVLDGCVRVTDSGLSLLKLACPGSQLSAMATSIVHLNSLAILSGCPLLIDPSGQHPETEKKAQVVVIPLKTQVSLSSYLVDGKSTSRQPVTFLREAKVRDWTLNFLEVDPQTPLFEHLVSPNLTQVVIPYDTSLDPKEVCDHIANTISLVLSKESVNPQHPTHVLVHRSTGSGFIVPFSHHHCILSEDGHFQSLSDSEQVQGMMVSRQPLSRTNPFFEVEVMENAQPESEGLVMGCMLNVLMSERFPMEVKDPGGGRVVQAFELTPGAKFGFGVEGSWKSEYVPSDTAVFYWTKDGVKMDDKTPEEKPHIGMYPVVISKMQACIKIGSFDAMPQDLLEEIKKKDLRHTHEFLYNMLCDENGVLTYQDNYSDKGGVGLFLAGESISEHNNSCSIKILDRGRMSTITLGLGPEKYSTGQQPSCDKNSIAFHGDDGRVYKGQSSEDMATIVLSPIRANDISGLSPFRVGDEVKVTVEGFSGTYVEKGDNLKVTFYLNDIKSKTFDLMYDAPKGVRCVFLIGMHSEGEKAQILNYRPRYFPVSPQRNKLTMGRCHYMNIMDDGTLTYRKFDRRNFLGLFVSKTPLSAHLPYFELQVTKLSAKKLLGIGLCHMFYPNEQMLGWRQGSVGYHADTGKLYYNVSQGMASAENCGIVSDGDTMGCGLDLAQAKFKADGSLEPQQTLMIYFTRNGKRVHEVQFEYLTEGLYPAVNLNKNEEVKLHNYVPSPESVRAGGEVEEKQSFTEEGCRFMVVGVSSSGQDISGKSQLVQEMFHPKQDLSALKHITAEIARLESNVSSLDVQSQQRYTQLLWQQECMERFIASKERLSFHCLDTKSGEGRDLVVDSIVNTLECDLELHSKSYAFPASVSQYLNSIVSTMKSQEILTPEDISKMVDNTTVGDNGRVCEKAVLFLQRKGYLTNLPWRKTLVVLDMDFVVSLTDSLGHCPCTPLDKSVPALGDKACAWDSETQVYTPAANYDSHRVSSLCVCVLFIVCAWNSFCLKCYTFLSCRHC